MTALVLEWAKEPVLDLQWVGPDGATSAQAERNPTAVAAVVGPTGAVGAVGPGFKLVGNEIRYDISSLTGA